MHISFLSTLRDLRAVPSYNWGGLAYSHLLYEMGRASRTALGSDPSMAALWSVLEVFETPCTLYFVFVCLYLELD